MRRNREADIERVLVYYDGPQILKLRGGKSLFIAIAIPEDSSGYDFSACSIKPETWIKYRRGSVDLRYLFTNRYSVQYKFKSKFIDSGKIQLKYFEKKLSEGELPEHRFFIYDQTDKSDYISFSEDQETLLVDGNWEMDEFGGFYQKYSEVYAFLAIASKIEEKNTNTAFFRDAMIGHPLKGGGSYKNLYRAASEKIDPTDLLSLKSIEYASPGEVKIRGNKNLFSVAEKTIKFYINNLAEAEKSYSELHTFLKNSKLLKTDIKKFKKFKTDDEDIRKRYIKLSESINFTSLKSLEKLLENNDLAVAKVLLAHHRRLKKTSSFVMEGRVHFR